MRKAVILTVLFTVVVNPCWAKTKREIQLEQENAKLHQALYSIFKGYRNYRTGCILSKDITVSTEKKCDKLLDAWMLVFPDADAYYSGE